MRIYNIIGFCLLMFIFSCTSSKEILYTQNINDYSDFTYSDYKIKVDDILKISVRNNIGAVSGNQFVITSPETNEGNFNSKFSYLIDGYQVDKKGEINYPSVGKLLVLGKTTNQISMLIKEILEEKEIYINTIIDVKILNKSFTNLGEVNKPGRYDFLENNLNIFEAIGISGDLTINGKREDVKVIREIENLQTVISVNLTEPNIIMNDAFQVFPNDIIIVNPNTARVKSAGLIGNAGNLLSVLSFIMSSIIVISNN